MKKKPTVMGVTCGIGSMLIGARAAGFRVLGNVDWRRYYHVKDDEGRNTFTENFPGAFFVHRLDELDETFDVDLVMGHPECGNFSQLSSTNKNRLEKLHDPADIPLFIDAVAVIRPRYFVMDDLPKSLIAFSMSEYMKRLPDYDLFPEWISNYHYGNPQKNRKRMFMIGALKSERFTFVPGETDRIQSVYDIMGDISGRYDLAVANHHRHVLDGHCNKANHMLERGRVYTWREVRAYFKTQRGGHTLPYVKADGVTVARRPGTSKGHWDGHAHVLDGGSPQINAKTNLPYTLRERLRIQGAPDDFVLYGEKLDSRGRWDHFQNIALIKQTGKFMPVQFCRYATDQILAHINGKPFKTSGQRLIPPNTYVTGAKVQFCTDVGYGDQKTACDACWKMNCGSPRCVHPERATLRREQSKRSRRLPRTTKRIKKIYGTFRKYERPSGKKLTNM